MYIDDVLSSLVSGHGVQIKDTNGDEFDGLDECSFLPSRLDTYD
jgi:hypothetical protein